MSYIIAASRPWYSEFDKRLQIATGKAFSLLQDPTALTVEYLDKIKPRYIFFPHWSYRIPAEIFENYECIIFHMTDVPFGRGGSPLQNLIARGIYETQISALQCVQEMDAGPVYLKRPLSLKEGSAQELYLEAADTIEAMIQDIVEKEPAPIPQEGDPVVFKRRKAEEGNLKELSNLQAAYDYIRMLDAEGYPPAYFETEHLRYEFHKAQRQENQVIAQVLITKKENQ